MCKRKIESVFQTWMDTPSHKPIVVKGVRQCGKSMRTVLGHPEKYHVDYAIKLGDYNVDRKDKLLTLPVYMAFLLKG